MNGHPGLRWLLFALCLGGCAAAPPLPSDYYYRLPAPEARQGAPLTSGTILVRPFRAEGVRGERAILYTEDADALVLQQHHYDFWVESPARLLQGQLAAFLRGSGAAPKVVTDVSIPGELAVSGSIERFEREVHGGSALAHVAMDLEAFASGNPQPLWKARYEASMPADDATVAASVRAFDRGIADIFRRFLDDLRAAYGTGAVGSARDGTRPR